MQVNIYCKTTFTSNLFNELINNTYANALFVIMLFFQCRSDQLDQSRSGNRVPGLVGRYERSGIAGKVYLGWHHSGFLNEYVLHVKTIRGAID